MLRSEFDEDASFREPMDDPNPYQPPPGHESQRQVTPPRNNRYAASWIFFGIGSLLGFQGLSTSAMSFISPRPIAADVLSGVMLVGAAVLFGFAIKARIQYRSGD
ncbi:hypothetical protein Poly51_63720 [Rubripirellula tenax]|uniref:Uncharacterized protein n=1 Tax=Rubripirellula tenax TaxID=2528015 RepID=A0A5C6E3E4_9BACT|nr:hypothetical protein [Rubripirellula tenax]TWU41699.1 hypothetical protein Poly51_63720 [Rubripirellula tenax]